MLEMDHDGFGALFEDADAEVAVADFQPCAADRRPAAGLREKESVVLDRRC